MYKMVILLITGFGTQKITKKSKHFIHWINNVIKEKLSLFAAAASVQMWSESNRKLGRRKIIDFYFYKNE